MLKAFETKGMGAGSFYKILLVGNLVSMFIFAIVFGLIAWLMPHSNVAAQEHQFSFMGGFLGFIILVVLSPVYAVITSFFQWLFIGFGLWLWTRFKTVTIYLSVVGADCCAPKDPMSH